MDAVDTIVRGTVITSGVTGFICGIYGIVRRSPKYSLQAVAAGVNSGITAFTFFALREAVISPLLINNLSSPQYIRRRNDPGTSNSLKDLPSWSDLRKYNTLDSGLSGAIAGGVLRGWKSGPRAILPSALTIGAVCTLLQLAFNEANVRRLRYITGLRVKVAPIEPPTEPPSKSTSERFLTFIGIHQVTDQEYIDKMKATREGYLKRIAELEIELAADKAREHSKDT